MFCMKCGTELPEGSVFCCKCGAKVQTLNDAPTYPSNAQQSGVNSTNTYQVTAPPAGSVTWMATLYEGDVSGRVGLYKAQGNLTVSESGLELKMMFGGALSNVTLITMVAGAAKSKKNFPKTIGFDEISECWRGKSLPGQPIIVVRLKNGAVFSFLSGFYQTQKVDQSYAIIQSHLQAR